MSKNSINNQAEKKVRKHKKLVVEVAYAKDNTWDYCEAVYPLLNSFGIIEGSNL